MAMMLMPGKTAFVRKVLFQWIIFVLVSESWTIKYPAGQLQIFYCKIMVEVGGVEFLRRI